MRSALTLALALAVSACTSAVTPDSSSPTISAPPSVARSAAIVPVSPTPVPTPAVLIPDAVARSFAPWGIVQNATLVGGHLVYSSLESDRQNEHMRIIDRDLDAGTERVLYDANEEIAQLQVSDSWIVWNQYADLWNASDAKVYAMPRGGGARVLIADPLAAANIWGRGYFMSLSDDTAYWTVAREIDGKWRGELYRRRLPRGDVEQVVAVDGSHVGWPTASGSVLYYTETEQGDYPSRSSTPGPSHVMRRDASGVTTRITDARYVATAGSLLVYIEPSWTSAQLPDGHVIHIGAAYEPGYPPTIAGDWVITGAETGGSITTTRPRDGCVAQLRSSEPPYTYTIGPAGVGPNQLVVQRLTTDAARTATIMIIDLARVACPH